jgi:hypothetical protein
VLLQGRRALCGLDTQHDPRRASAFAWRTCGHDNGLLGALEPVDLIFKFGDLPLALGQGTWRIRNPIDLGQQPLSQHVRLNEG